MHAFIFKRSPEEDYEKFALKNKDYSLWQSLAWKNFQEKIGRNSFLVGVKDKGELIATALLVKHSLPFKKCWFEIPRGPLFDKNLSADDLNSAQKMMQESFQELAKKENVIFYRFNPYNKKISQLLKEKKAFKESHPPNTLLIDLTKPEEEILKQMKQKGRYNIRVAEKKGVKIVQSKDVAKYHQLVLETTKRDKFSGHSQDYYQKMIESMGDDCLLYLAEFEGEVIAGGIFTFISQRAVYYYGASSNKYRNLMAPYLLQWEAMKEAKKRGCTSYDFLGIAPEGKEKGHHLAGVTSFKRKFGGEVKNYPVGRDLVFQTLWYWMYKLKKLF